MIELVLTVLVLAVILTAVNKLPGGCTGDCRQGRDPCNCKEQK